MKKKANRFLLGLLAGLLAIGLVLAGCDNGTDSGSNNNTQQGGTNTGTGGTNTGTGGDNTGTGGTNTGTGGTNTGTGGDNTGTGGTNTGTGGTNTGTGGDNTGTGGTNTGTGGNGDGTTSQDDTFTPPTKAQLQEFLESYRTNTANKIAGENAAVYIKSITVNTYTIGGTSITTNPSAVPENADVKVKFTVRTVLIFSNLSMGERLNIDNFRIALMDALGKWLKQRGFKNVPSSNITTGDTVFG